jgi:cyclopropane-fatty-acyl-phospholipid synthase
MMSTSSPPLSQRLLEAGWLPDPVIRYGIRRTIAARLRQESAPTPDALHARKAAFVAARSDGPLAVATDDANAQHYEVPTAFYQRVLGPHLKYSSSYWDDTTVTLADAEARMLTLTCERAELSDGQRVLELGCGWGSLSLWMARRYPTSSITVVSNSRTQKQYIDRVAQAEGLRNLTVVTANMNTFTPDGTFDRVVSVEMFEHMRNWRELFARIASWLRPDGRLFFHIFTHRQYAYAYEVRDSSDWMAEHFFTGGIMPSDDFPRWFPEHLEVEAHWAERGTHYQRTAEAWLRNMDQHTTQLQPLFEQTYGAEWRVWWIRWRVFFMACAELWAWRGGDEWLVSHYRMRRAEAAATA